MKEIYFKERIPSKPLQQSNQISDLSLLVLSVAVIVFMLIGITIFPLSVLLLWKPEISGKDGAAHFRVRKAVTAETLPLIF
jgi:hypothetical protein